jgi:hypothetical protein
MHTRAMPLEINERLQVITDNLKIKSIQHKTQAKIIPKQDFNQRTPLNQASLGSKATLTSHILLVFHGKDFFKETNPTEEKESSPQLSHPIQLRPEQPHTVLPVHPHTLVPSRLGCVDEHQRYGGRVDEKNAVEEDNTQINTQAKKEHAPVINSGRCHARYRFFNKKKHPYFTTASYPSPSRTPPPTPTV